MKVNRRWMRWVLEESAKETPALPWTRGNRQWRRVGTGQARGTGH